MGDAGSLYTFFGGVIHRVYESFLKVGFQFLEEFVHRLLGHPGHTRIERDPQIVQGARYRRTPARRLEKLPHEIPDLHTTPLSDFPTVPFFHRPLDDDEPKGFRQHREHATRHLESEASMESPSAPHRNGQDTTRDGVDGVEQHPVTGPVKSSNEVEHPEEHAEKRRHYDVPTRPFMTGSERLEDLWVWWGKRHHEAYTRFAPIAFL